MRATQATRMALDQIESVIFEETDLVDRFRSIDEAEALLAAFVYEMRGRACYEAEHVYTRRVQADIVGVGRVSISRWIGRYMDARRKPRNPSIFNPQPFLEAGRRAHADRMADMLKDARQAKARYQADANVS